MATPTKPDSPQRELEMIPTPEKLSPMRLSAANKGLALLKAAGVPHGAIIDGVNVGPYKVVLPTSSPNGKRPRQFNNLTKYDYQSTISKSPEGTELDFRVGGREEGRSLSGSISSWGIRNGYNLLVHYAGNDPSVKVLVVSKPTQGDGNAN